MILTCPSCRARYVVPDSAIGAGGRKVRCAKCRFSWHQEGPELSLAPGEPSIPLREAVVEPPAEEPAPAPRRGAARPPEPVQEDEPETATEDAEEGPPPDWVGEHEPLAEEEPEQPRRRGAWLWTTIAIVTALLIVGGAAAVYFTGWPQISERLGLAAGTAQRLAISGRVSREQLPTNTELLTVTGEIRNLTDEVQRVPQIRADLLDANGRVVYSWAIAPPRTQIQPGETISFNSASTDAPSGGQSLSLSFAPLT